jgi:hypothetical protein
VTAKSPHEVNRANREWWSRVGYTADARPVPPPPPAQPPKAENVIDELRGKWLDSPFTETHDNR